MKPGKTSFPVASITSVPGGTSRGRSDRADGLIFDVDIARETRIRSYNLSALDQQAHLYVLLRHSRLTSDHKASVNVNSHPLAICLHRLPVFGDLRLLLG